MKKTTKTRFNLRLSAIELADIDDKAVSAGCSRSSLIDSTLAQLTHDLQTNRIRSVIHAGLLTYNKNNYRDCVVNVRLPRIIVDYLRMNCYNISSCIRFAAAEYEYIENFANT